MVADAMKKAETISVAFGEGAENFEEKTVTVKGVVYDSEERHR